MAAALGRAAARELAWLPSLQCVRHGSKAVTRHKKPMHFERQKIMGLTKYIPPPKPSNEKCLKLKTKPEATEQVTRMVLGQFQLQEMLSLFTGRTFLVVSSQLKVKEMLQAVRTAPQIVLLGACVENRLLSHQGVVNYSKLPSKETMHGQLVSTLASMTSQTSRLLTHHSSHLSSLLEQHCKKDVKSA